jgi:GH24 family phage-related lysozyme (muramidase)
MSNARSAPPRISEAALSLIRRFEGLRLKAYRDAAGIWTIGYGHTSMAGPPKVRPGMRITKAEAEEILRRDVETFARAVARAIGDEALEKLNENQFGALVSFAYNVGLANFRRSSVLRAVKEGRLNDVPRLLMRWTKARDPRSGRLKRLRGLVRRRRAEGELFMAVVRRQDANGPSPSSADARAGEKPPPEEPARETVLTAGAGRARAATAASPGVSATPEGPKQPSANPAKERGSLPGPGSPRPDDASLDPKTAAGAVFFTALTAMLILWLRRARVMRAAARWLRERLRWLKGWRTLLFSLLLATLGVAEATNWADLVPDGPAKGWVLLAIALTIAWLRVITTTPPGRAA